MYVCMYGSICLCLWMYLCKAWYVGMCNAVDVEP